MAPDEETPRDWRWAFPVGIVGAVVLILFWFWGAPTLIAFVLTAPSLDFRA